MRDATGNKFRLAVAEAKGDQLGELLQSGEGGFPEDLSKSHLSMREAFLHHAISVMAPEIRQPFCQAALATLGDCTLSPAANRIKEVLTKARDGKFQAPSAPPDDE